MTDQEDTKSIDLTGVGKRVRPLRSRPWLEPSSSVRSFWGHPRARVVEDRMV